MTQIAQTEAYLTELRDLVEPPDVLKSRGYIMQPLTFEELLLQRRCLTCGKTMSKLTSKKSKRNDGPILEKRVGKEEIPIAMSALSLSDDHVASESALVEPSAALGSLVLHHYAAEEPTPAPRYRCKFHPGGIVGTYPQKHWTCCNQHITADPCHGAETHSPQDYDPEDLIRIYQYHCTSSTAALAISCRAVVALDCEMGTALSGDSELIRVTLIDFFSGAILLNNLVEPDVPMQHLNTRFSGVTWRDIREAKKRRRCFLGKAAALQAVWTYVTPDTIVVGHGLHNDLRSLRWIHPLVVDSFMIESSIRKKTEAEQMRKLEEEVQSVAQRTCQDSTAASVELKLEQNQSEAATNLGKEQNDAENLVQQDPIVAADAESPEVKSQEKIHNEHDASGAKQGKKRSRRDRPGNLSLKTLMKKRLDRDIQMGDGKTGHDSLEDAIAARDLIHWHITHPEKREERG